MASRRPLTVLGFFGTQLDRGVSAKRWERWRPTASLFHHEDLLVDRLDLLVSPTADSHVEQLVEDIRRLAPETEVVTHAVRFEDPWDFEEVYGTLHEFARGYAFEEEREYWIHITTGTHVGQICWFLLAESRFVPAKLLQTAPPKRGERGAGGSWRVIDLDLGRYDGIAARFDREARAATSFLKEGIETRSEAFNSLIDRIERVALRSTAPVLLTGPTGAGKSRLARRIYELKRERRQVKGRFVEVNCATLRGDGAMSALFGHTRGAFTGAVGARPGLLAAADGGVLFLDEIGELGVDEQAMLLRAIEDKRFLPVGADREVSSDFQLLAGTNRDLRERVAEGGFREDLLARINLWTFDLPGLAQRREDIEPNLDYELEQFARRSSRRVTLNREARDAFLAFAYGREALWRGNFRDLNAAVTRMATLAEGGRITPADVAEEAGRLRYAWERGSRSSGKEERFELVDRVLGEAAAELDRFDRVQLEDVLKVCSRSRTLSEAGRALFSVSRTKRSRINDTDRVRKYLLRFGLSWSDLAVLQGGSLAETSSLVGSE